VATVQRQVAVLYCSNLLEAQSVALLLRAVHHSDTCHLQASDDSQGLSVEALKMYQDKLPDRPGVRKVNVAVSNPESGDTTIDFFYIHPDDITSYRLPPWLIGCNAAGKPQTEAARILKNRNLTKLMRTDRVPVVSFEQLTAQHAVTSIGYLKVDVEGHEPVILRSMMRACAANPAVCPRAVKFEHKHVKGYDQRALIAELATHGYTVISHTTGEHRDYVLAHIGGKSGIRANIADDPSIVKKVSS
jgi:FkbM family methyltransferase